MAAAVAEAAARIRSEWDADEGRQKEGPRPGVPSAIIACSAQSGRCTNKAIQLYATAVVRAAADAPVPCPVSRPFSFLLSPLPLSSFTPFLALTPSLPHSLSLSPGEGVPELQDALRRARPLPRPHPLPSSLSLSLPRRGCARASGCTAESLVNSGGLTRGGSRGRSRSCRRSRGGIRNRIRSWQEWPQGGGVSGVSCCWAYACRCGGRRSA